MSLILVQLIVQSSSMSHRRFSQKTENFREISDVKKDFYDRVFIGLIAFPLSAVPSWKPLGMPRPCTTITPVALGSSSSSTFPRTETFREAASLTVSFNSSFRVTADVYCVWLRGLTQHIHCKFSSFSLTFDHQICWRR